MTLEDASKIRHAHLVHVCREDLRIRVQQGELLGLGATTRAEIDDHLRRQAAGRFDDSGGTTVLNPRSRVRLEQRHQLRMGTLPDRACLGSLVKVDRRACQAVVGSLPGAGPTLRPDPAQQQAVTQG